MYSIKIISVERIRVLERQADEAGISYADMMERAGLETARIIRCRTGSEGRRIAVLVGPGNNGGDGLVAAHYLAEMGARVSCYIWKRNIGDDANFQRVTDDRLQILWAADDARLGALDELAATSDIIVDALLGVGVSRPIGGQLEQILATVRRAQLGRCATRTYQSTIPSATPQSLPYTVAVDCPTGLNCDTGALDPAALNADLTVTFAYPKHGLLRFPGVQAVGELVVADIGIPAELTADVDLELAAPALVRSWLPARPSTANKGTFGRVLIVGGSVNYVGAAILCGAAATRVGAGLVTMALPAPIQSSVAAHLVEATYLLLPHNLGVVATPAESVLEPRFADCGALLLGPGLTTEPETVRFVHAVLGIQDIGRKARLGFLDGAGSEGSRLTGLPPLIVDADGLNAIAPVARWWSFLPSGSILTPHPGEMARLMGGDATVGDVQADRVGIAREMAEQWGVVVVLKGALTVIAEPGHPVVVLPFANAGLATAGSGDVLSGAIAGLRAQGLSPFEAAVTGAYLHGLSGELAREELGNMGMVAGDLPPRLPHAIKCVREEGEG